MWRGRYDIERLYMFLLLYVGDFICSYYYDMEILLLFLQEREHMTHLFLVFLIFMLL